MTVEIISFGSPVNPLNPLSASTRIRIADSIRKAIDNFKTTSIVLYGGKNFSAGADINEFSPKNWKESSEEVPDLTEISAIIESCPKPVIAIVTGFALGGGFELALSCHYRIASSNAQFGLPEVKIGLIPGAGGTQRLPRLSKNVGWALQVISSGRMVGVKEARRMGIVDEVIGEVHDIIEVGKRWAKYAELVGDMAFRRVCEQRVLLQNDLEAMNANRKICENFLKKKPTKERGGEALHAVVQAVKASFEEKSFEEGMAVETELFNQLLWNSKQGRALRYVFFSERLAQKSQKKVIHSENIKTLLKADNKTLVGVIGAGTMGSGIAICFLRAGYKVILLDNNAASLQKGRQIVKKILNQDVSKKRMSPSKVSHILNYNFIADTDMKSCGFSECLLVVEAVFENLKVKQSIFRQLDMVLTNADALVLSNTSTLNIDSITNTLKPERRPYSAGMHFFSPAHAMKLVELVKGSVTSRETIAALQIITRNLRKVGVTVGNCDGFVGNRMIQTYTSESNFILVEGGASVPSLDRTIESFGMAIGPMTMGDLAGNDIGYQIRKEGGLVKDPTTELPGPKRRSGMRYTDLGDDLVVKLGRIGQKKMKGWYDYDSNIGKGRKPIPSKEVADFIAYYSKESTTYAYSANEIVERVFFALVNEGFKILEEGIAQSPSDIDVIYVYGYGWPVWRGGPMYWADNEVGLAHLLHRLEEFDKRYPGSSYYVPSSLLKKCVKMNITIQEYYERGLHKSKILPLSKL